MEDKIYTEDATNISFSLITLKDKVDDYNKNLPFAIIGNAIVLRICISAVSWIGKMEMTRGARCMFRPLGGYRFCPPPDLFWQIGFKVVMISPLAFVALKSAISLVENIGKDTEKKNRESTLSRRA